MWEYWIQALESSRRLQHCALETFCCTLASRLRMRHPLTKRKQYNQKLSRDRLSYPSQRREQCWVSILVDLPLTLRLLLDPFSDLPILSDVPFVSADSFDGETCKLLMGFSPDDWSSWPSGHSSWDDSPFLSLSPLSLPLKFGFGPSQRLDYCRIPNSLLPTVLHQNETHQ